MITNSMISWGDQLGAQLITLAQLYYLAEENNNKLVLLEELKCFRRGYQFLDVFDIKNIQLINNSGKIKKYIINNYCKQFIKKTGWKKKMNRMYSKKIMNKIDKLFYEYIMLSYKKYERINKLKNNVHYDPMLLKIESDKSYDILNGYGTYRDWGKYGNDIRDMLKFKEHIVMEGQAVLNKLNIEKQTVSLHFRRTDYLVLSSLNLDMDYYVNAMKQFEGEDVVYLVFSDDIEECKNMDILKDKEVVFMETRSAGVDMYLMSQCNHNIIANSTFSFWGAYLSRHINKKVVCPHDFIGDSSQENMYINGNYYPENWIAL